MPNASERNICHLQAHYSKRQQVQIVAVISLFGFLNRWNDTLATTLSKRLQILRNNTWHQTAGTVQARGKPDVWTLACQGGGRYELLFEFLELIHEGPDNLNAAPTEKSVLVSDPRARYPAANAWWLTPSWAKQPSTRYSMFNAKAKLRRTCQAFASRIKSVVAWYL